MRLIHHGVNMQSRVDGSGEHLLGFRFFGRRGTLDLFEAAIFRELKRLHDAERFRQHIELDRFFDGQARIRLEKWNGECRGTEKSASSHAAILRRFDTCDSTKRSTARSKARSSPCAAAGSSGIC